MNWFTLISLSLGILIILLCSAAMILIPSTYARIHYLGPASTLGTFLISFSILFQEGFSSAGIKSILFALFIVMYGPVLSHAASRAKRIRVYGIWQQWDVSKKRKKK